MFAKSIHWTEQWTELCLLCLAQSDSWWNSLFLMATDLTCSTGVRPKAHTQFTFSHVWTRWHMTTWCELSESMKRISIQARHTQNTVFSSSFIHSRFICVCLCRFREKFPFVSAVPRRAVRIGMKARATLHSIHCVPHLPWVNSLNFKTVVSEAPRKEKEVPYAWITAPSQPLSVWECVLCIVHIQANAHLRRRRERGGEMTEKLVRFSFHNFYFCVAVWLVLLSIYFCSCLCKFTTFDHMASTIIIRMMA